MTRSVWWTYPVTNKRPARTQRHAWAVGLRRTSCGVVMPEDALTSADKAVTCRRCLRSLASFHGRRYQRRAGTVAILRAVGDVQVRYCREWELVAPVEQNAPGQREEPAGD